MVSEVEIEGDLEDDDELVADGGDQPATSLDEVLQMEAEGLAQELEEAAECGLDSDTLQQVEESVEGAAEALLTMREAKVKLQEVKKDRGYGRATPADQKGKMNPKKQSSKHPCFDCGLPGHWAGDPECSKPGQGLGRKNKPVKQVKVTEAMNVEVGPPAADPGNEVLMAGTEGHEVLVTGTFPMSNEFLAAFEQSHLHPQEVNVAGKLAADKMLVGALDSACNRTCTGTEWLNTYLRCLRTAPQHVRDLVKSHKEYETFKFGNGGTQVSVARWRLPMQLDGSVVCFWTSLVPVPSLGLLLGRDFLEAIGADMHFAHRTLRCETITGKPIPLKQLAAGRFLLPLAPGAWPGVEPRRWKKLGVDGVLELQLNPVQWLSKKLSLCTASMKSRPHDHLLTESSVQFGHLVCAVSRSTDAFGSPVQASGDSMSVGLASPSNSSSSSRQTSSIHVRPMDDRRRPDKGRDKAHGREHRKMEADVHPHGRKVSLGSKRFAPVAFAKALLAIAAVSLSLHDNGNGLDSSSSTAGYRWNHPQKSAQEVPGGQPLHDGQPQRMPSPSKQARLAHLIHRGPNAPWHDGCPDSEGHHFQASSRSSEGGKRAGFEGRGRWTTGGGSKDFDRSSRRSALSQSRSGEVGGASACRAWRERLSGHDQREGETDDCSAQGKTFRGSSSSAQDRRSRISKLISHSYEALQGQALGHGSSAAGDAHDDGANASGDGSSSSSGRELGHGGGHRAKSGSGLSGLGLSRELHRGGDQRAEWAGIRRSLRSDFDSSVRGRDSSTHLSGDQSRSAQSSRDLSDANEFRIHQDVKKGQAQMIAQAWLQHEQDRKKVSQAPKRMREMMICAHEQEMLDFMTEEIFVQPFDLSLPYDKVSDGFEALQNEHVPRNVLLTKNGKPPDKNAPLVSEIYTTAQNVMKEAERRGHKVGSAMSLENGWNFLLAEHRHRALQVLDEEKPYCVVLAFPCGPWSPLQFLNAKGNATLDQRRADGMVLMEFAIEVAKHQMAGGRHFVMENPLPSLAWKTLPMQKFIEENNVEIATFDQCRFNLRSLLGELHKKPTQMVSSSPRVIALLHGLRCKRDHSHAPVLGGSKITAHAGIYPKPLARALVSGIMEQFDLDFQPNETMAAQVGDEEDGAGDGLLALGEEVISEDEELDGPVDPSLKITPSLKNAIKRLHENTGHRSNKRLARALAVAGAPVEAIAAAKSHKCSLCQERAQPKTRRPAALPTPKDVSDQVHVDLIEMEDCAERRFYIAHATDFATRFQVAEVLPNKSSKAVINFLSSRWVAMFGAPRVLVADQGREFVSWEMEEWASSVSTMLHHIAVQAPWQNGVAERSGSALKAILTAVVKAHSVIGEEELQQALSEALAAYNQDVNDSGFSPYQAVFGRQPRMVGDTLGSIESRLAEHSLIDGRTQHARLVALRETAKVAMMRLHHSKGLRRAELARSRSSTLEQVPTPGTICYFYRPLRFNNKTSPSRKRLTLKRWHGPALLVATEGHSSAFLSYKGQLTKAAMEHVRVASGLEQIAAGSWRDAIEEVVEAAQHDLTLRGLPEALPPVPEDPQEGDVPVPMTPALRPPMAPIAPEPGADLPPVQPRELVQVAQQAPPLPSVVGDSVLPSRRMSDVSGPVPGSPVPELIRRAGTGSILARQIAQAREASEELGGVKRPAEVGTEELADEARSRPSAPSAAHESMTVACEKSEACEKAGEDLMKQFNDPTEHPLRVIAALAEKDKLQPLDAAVQDHGSWGGRWHLPSRSEWQLHHKLGWSWPNGSTETEVMLASAAHKELFWKNMTPEEKKAFHIAAKDAWQVWEDNQAVEVLSIPESEAIRSRLRMNKEVGKILTPRFVFTDKHSGLRTAERPLPLKARARVVVPGFRDVLSFAIRKDAPTGSRLSQHMLFILTASNNKAVKGEKNAWRLVSADVKSAFLKGDPYMAGDRELYMENMKDSETSDAPGLPFGRALVKIRKGVFGLADAPRQWYLRLNRALLEQGWERSSLDYACWLLWSNDKTTLDGVIISHVDDLLLGGGPRAQALLQDLGKLLGFGSVEYDDFTYCGKRIRQHEEDGSISISISMVEYHSNLKPVAIPVHRRAQAASELNDGERRQLRAILGSLQWLLAQLRFDLAYHLSVLQGEKPVIMTLMKANALLKRFKKHSQFELRFRPLRLDRCGIMVVTDSSLGNVTKEGVDHGSVLEKIYSQSCYYVLVADSDLLAGREGSFCVLDSRSHRLSRVCRSTFAAELLGAEEGLDAGMFCRGLLAMFKGFPIHGNDGKMPDEVLDSIPLVQITDAKDLYDKGNSDTATYGAQKSLGFTIGWVRATLARAATSLKWTSTDNMFVDCGTKDMDESYLHRILAAGRWCYTYNQEYVKQGKSGKKQLPLSATANALDGEPLDVSLPIAAFLQQLSESPGWHHKDGVVTHVAHNARSFRNPSGRYLINQFPLRTTYARYDLDSGISCWRVLEDRVKMSDLSNKQALLGQPARILVTVFSASHEQRKEKSL